MSTSFYAGPASSAASVEIAWRSNRGDVTLKNEAPLDVCPCCMREYPARALVAHDEYGHEYTRHQLAEELGPGFELPKKS